MQRHIEGLAGEAKKSISGASEEWGLDIGNNMAQIANAERIIPPTLEFAKRREEDPEGEKYKAVKSGRNGDTAGEFDFRGRRFYKARCQKSCIYGIYINSTGVLKIFQGDLPSKVIERF